MNTIKQYAPKVSDALRAMVAGLLEQDAREDFNIDMGSYGKFTPLPKPYKGVCFGCAATCAIQKLVGKNFNSEYIRNNYTRALFLDIDHEELWQFEMAINSFRLYTDLRPLFEFYYGEEDFKALKLPCSLVYGNNRLGMTNENWRDKLPVVNYIIAELKELGQ